LDGLRGVAILGVLAYHSRLLPGGFVGVDLFFALSGYLITSLLLEEWRRHGDIRLPAFWARRMLRLAPALVLGVAFTYAAAAYVGLPLRAEWVAASLLYAANLLIGYGGVYPLGLLSHMWSLGMEEQFYLVWPLLLVGASRFGALGVSAAALLLSVVPALLRLWYTAAHPADPNLWLRVYFAPDMRFDAIALGCLAGAWLPFRTAPGPFATRAIQLAAIGGALWLALVAVGAQIATLVAHPMLFSVTSVAATAVVLGAIRLPLLEWPLSSPPLVWLGRISYGLYVIHVAVFVLLAAHPFWLQWAAAIALAAASYRFWEQPFLRLKRRFARDPAPDEPAAAGARPAA
jgi:peptidoglycan/LPS O-acetylase OafA/YrhL